MADAKENNPWGEIESMAKVGFPTPVCFPGKNEGLRRVIRILPGSPPGFFLA
jgi:hypothetical protein